MNSAATAQSSQRRALRWVLLFVLCASSAGPQNYVRRPSLLPDGTIQALLEELSGENALRHSAIIGSHARYPGSAGFRRALGYIREQAKAAGLEQVEMHRFPDTDVGWDAMEAQLDMLEPEARRLGNLRDVPVLLAMRSRDADVTAELVDVGTGRDPGEYEGKDVAGKLVLASGHPLRVQQEAIFKRQAAGIISYFRASFHGLAIPETATAWGSINWRGPNGAAGAFAFMIPARLGEELRTRLARKEKVRLRAFAKVAAQEAAGVEMLSAVLPGKGVQDQDIVVSAHVDHPLPSANDNASGSAALLEMARTLVALRDRNSIPPLRRNIRFWWVTELKTPQAYIFAHPEQSQRILVNINVDQAGGDRLARNDFLVQASQRVAPTFLNALVDHFGQYAMRNLAPVHQAPSPLFVAPTGTRDAFVMRIWRDEDERPVTDSFAFVGLGIGAVNVCVPSFHLIHSSADTVERLDPTQLKRTSYMALAPALYLAMLTPEQVPALADTVFSYGTTETAMSVERALSVRNAASADRIRDAFAYQHDCLESLRPLAAGRAEAVDHILKKQQTLARIGAAYREFVPAAPSSAEETKLEETVPVMSSALGQRDKKIWDFAAMIYPEWYAKHLVDNRRSVMDIYRAIHGMYPDYRLADLKKYLQSMEDAGLVRMKSSRP